MNIAELWSGPLWSEPSTAALVNHIWQSTIFAAAVWLLTLTLRRNHARVRYRLWMVASVKFFVPLSLFIGAGEYFRSAMTGPIARPDLSAAMEQIAEPFSQTPVTGFVGPAAAIPAVAGPQIHFWPFILFVLWACGALLVASRWLRRWSRLRETVRAASAIPVAADVPVLSSQSRLEPGVFGIFKPVLLLPAGIHTRITGPQLEAIVAHEMSHIRRRDNLTAAMHMLVEAVFWFHPMIWWIGTQLVEERERACDEAVLQSSRDAEVYAEGILNVCKAYFESPLPCLSSVAGPDLKQRIIRILTKQAGRKLDLSRKLLLSVAAVMALALPVGLGLFHARESRAQSAPANPAPEIAATWQGILRTNRDLRIVVRITKAGDGTLRAVYYNIDDINEAPEGVPAISTTWNGSLLKIELPFGTYDGTASADGDSIAGTWSQGPNSLPLNFARATAGTEWTIPRPPPRLPPMAADANPKFEVASIRLSRPDEHGPRFWFENRRFSVTHTSLADLVKFSFGLQQREIAGAPDWFAAERFDISAEPDGEGEPSFKQWQSMVGKLMADRFQLKFHYEKRELPVYVLTIAKTGPKLTKSQSANTGLGFGAPGNFGATDASMADFAQAMGQAVLDRPVVDQTGLTGKYDFRLTWTPDETQFGAEGGYRPAATENPDAPPHLFEAIQEELGLKLEPAKAAVDVLVIDHVEQPSAN